MAPRQAGSFRPARDFEDSIQSDGIGRFQRGDGIADLPIIPREIEDILTITASERKRWLEDGRLPSAGTRTGRLQGRARKITFHVFAPESSKICSTVATRFWSRERTDTGDLDAFDRPPFCSQLLFPVRTVETGSHWK
jgi:hypothetical protein